MYGGSPPSPVEEVVDVIPHEGRLRANAAAGQDEAGDGLELFAGFLDALESNF
jgi:hypothetical protein